MKHTSIHDEARGRWPSILLSLGVQERYLRNRHGPCPICTEGKDRYRFDDKDGMGTYYCEKCGAGSGIDLVMKLFGMDFTGAVKKVREKLPNSFVATHQKPPKETPEKEKEKLLAIWKASTPVTYEDDAGRYLTSRGLKMPSGKTLRLHPGLDYFSAQFGLIGNFPCMVAAITDVNGKCVALHRTWLSNGAKAPVEQPKKSLGTFSYACAIQLYEITDTLAVAEGIETSIAAQELFGFPCWSIVSAGQMERFEWPREIKRLIIFGDNDESFTGQKCGYALAFRAKAKGLEVDVKFPETPGMDWVDVLGKKNASTR